MNPTTTTTTVKPAEIVNGINVTALRDTMGAVRADPKVAKTHWAVKTDWLGGTVSRTRVAGCGIGGQWIERPFEFVSDEPHELCGTNTQPNPQEYLLGALNAEQGKQAVYPPTDAERENWNFVPIARNRGS